MKLPQYFKPLFWSYKFPAIDSIKDKKRIIINTINYGLWDHWQWLFRTYGPNEIKDIIKETPATEFRPQVLKLISLLLGIKKMKYASRGDYVKTKRDTK